MAIFYQTYIRSLNHDVFLRESSAKAFIQKHVSLMRNRGALIKKCMNDVYIIEVDKTNIYTAGISTFAIPFEPDPDPTTELVIYQIVKGSGWDRLFFPTLETAREEVKKLSEGFRHPKNPEFVKHRRIVVDTPDRFVMDIVNRGQVLFQDSICINPIKVIA